MQLGKYRKMRIVTVDRENRRERNNKKKGLHGNQICKRNMSGSWQKFKHESGKERRVMVTYR